MADRKPEFKVDNTDSEEWEIVHNEISDDDDEGRRGDPVPSVKFAGTWGAAKHEATEVGSKMANATLSYAGAIASSGIPSLGKAAGAALAATAARTALSAAQYALEKTGTNQRILPNKLQGWLKGKEDLDEAKERAAEAKRAREQRKIKAQLISTGEVTDAHAQCPAVFEPDRSVFDVGSDSTDNLSDMSAYSILTSRGYPASTAEQFGLNRANKDATAGNGEHNHSSAFVSQFLNSNPSSPSLAAGVEDASYPFQNMDVFGKAPVRARGASIWRDLEVPSRSDVSNAAAGSQAQAPNDVSPYMDTATGFSASHPKSGSTIGQPASSSVTAPEDETKDWKVAVPKKEAGLEQKCVETEEGDNQYVEYGDNGEVLPKDGEDEF